MVSGCCFGVTLTIFIILLVLAVLAVVLVCVIPNLRLVHFSAYTATVTQVFYNGDFSSQPRREFSKETFFTDYKYLIEGITEAGEPVSRTFKTGKSGMFVSCTKVGSHENCQARSDYDQPYGYAVPGSAQTQILELDIDCSGLSSSTRKVSKCTVLAYASGRNLVTSYVESDTEYPILDHIVSSSGFGTGAVNIIKYYNTFSDVKPTDETNLKPFNSDTVIWDFRDGRGDSGNGGYPIYAKSTPNGGFFNSLSRMFARTRQTSNTPKYDLPEDMFMKVIRHEEELRRLLRMPHPGLSGRSVVRSSYNNSVRATIPESFDARTAFSDCSSVIGTIVNQQSCGSCWAMASSSVLSDRLCISKGIKQQLSPQYLVYCAMHNNGCNGGSLINTWEDVKSIGIPAEQCLPFKAVNGICPKRCENGEEITESNTIHPTGYVLPWGKTDEERVQAIQKEIMTNGPVDARFIVFSDFNDFFNKGTGVYHRSKEAVSGGGHAVRIIGWGKENGEDYWLIANSWGTENPGKGVFKMRRGNNECNIEEQVAAGVFE